MTRPRVLVIGSGIAGLSFALKAAEWASVLVVTKKSRADSNTNWARGGIAAGLGPDDDPALHLDDTLRAGDGLCHPDRVEAVVREGPERVRELVEWGVRFHRENGELSLGREGGHSRRRIVRAGDRTGREIERALLSAVARHEHIQLIQHLLVVDLLVEASPAGRRCLGAVALDYRRGVQVELRAPMTLLAAGGAGQVYLHTTNPTVATGDGIAMAYRAGAQVANMEFVQFHPTALYPTEDPAFLISEAIRGEGALLRLQDGSLFMEDRDPMGSLASRDIVARAIHQEMGSRGQSHVLLDISPIPRATMEARFPGAVEGCRARGIELFAAGIPVVPAAHYMCGGVVTDEMGRSSVKGLLASGEVAFTGVHGANRLASNSLLEAVVFSHRAAEAARSAAEGVGESAYRVADSSPDPADGLLRRLPGQEASEALTDRRQLVRTLMWKDVGIVRTDRGLTRAMDRLTELRAEEEDRWAREGWSLAGVELRNLLEVARLIAASALLRKESRGLHFNADHPERDDERFLADTLLDPLDR